MNRIYLLLLYMMFNYSLYANEYYTYDSIDSTLHAWLRIFGEKNYQIPSNLEKDYGIIYNLDTIGYSSQKALPIFAVQLSDNANIDEDEVKVLILGQCHAEEIYGVEISMAIIECYLDPTECYKEYHHSYLEEVLSKSLEKVDLWIVPTHNPEGLKVVHGYCDDSSSETKTDCNINNSNWIEDSTYRKNIRDTNDNSMFLENIDWEHGVGNDKDGVDLNRNYDINWIFGDNLYEEANSCNNNYNDNYDYYRGSEPFSELEIQGIRDLAIDKNFFLSIAYHSSRSGCVAEKVIFPWGWRKDSNESESFRKKSPDYPVISLLGNKIHEILKFSSADGAVPQGSRTGNAHDWFYKETGCFQYLIEVGEFNYDDAIGDEPINSYHDPEDGLLIDNKYSDTIEENLEAFFYIIMTAAGENVAELETELETELDLSQVTGIVKDEQGNAVTEAIVTILEMDGLVLKPRVTDEFGRFRRLLDPDLSYTLVVSAPGYIADTIAINNLSSGINIMDIELVSKISYQLNLNIQVPDNYTGDIHVIRKGPFSTDTSTATNNIAWSLPEDNYQISITASGLSPTVIKTLLNQNKEYSIFLNIEETIFNEDFNDPTQWETQSDNYWVVNSGYLKTQLDLDYAENVDWEIISNNGIDAEVGDSLTIEIHLRYELEWEHDYFSMFYISGDNTTELLQLTGDHYEFITEYIPLEIEEGQENGKILFTLNSDQNLNYRGVEIDKLVIYKGGDYTGTNLSNSLDLLPENFVLHQNYPNPFNPTTKINFSVPSIASVSVSTYNIRGEFIDELVNDIYQPGNYSVTFNAGQYASGIYLYQLKSDNVINTKKFIIIK